MLKELIVLLESRGVNFIREVDISTLSDKENRGYSAAILIGMVLSPGYIFRLSKENILDRSEFSQKENKTDKLAEWTADFITARGYKAYAQSERKLLADGFYNETTKTTLLPHKTIAVMAGLGWIGKNNLLITTEWGCALSMCSILTNAPLPTENMTFAIPRCGTCSVCKDACQVNALHGTSWEKGIDRDLIVDVYHCNQCLKCLADCPWTQKFMKRNQMQE